MMANVTPNGPAGNQSSPSLCSKPNATPSNTLSITITTSTKLCSAAKESQSQQFHCITLRMSRRAGRRHWGLHLGRGDGMGACEG